LRSYYGRKRPLAVWSLGVALAAGFLLAFRLPLAGVALVIGTVCGVLNSLLSMQSNERLLDHRSVALFVISSIGRIVVFAIVPVEFALHAPWWTMLAYFAGFFLPLALYTLMVARAVRTNS